MRKQYNFYFLLVLSSLEVPSPTSLDISVSGDAAVPFEQPCAAFFPWLGLSSVLHPDLSTSLPRPCFYLWEGTRVQPRKADPGRQLQPPGDAWCGAESPCSECLESWTAPEERTGSKWFGKHLCDKWCPLITAPVISVQCSVLLFKFRILKIWRIL